MPRKARRYIPFWPPEEDSTEDKQKIIFAIVAYFATGINIALLFIIGFRTVISTTFLISLYFILTFLTYVYFKRKKMSRAAVKAYGLIPTVLNLTLLLNYSISFNSRKENFRFNRNQEEVLDKYSHKTRWQMTSIITLENNAYEHAWGIRVFKSQQEIAGTERIAFTFETGLLGIDVMKDYDFH